jgi:Domain of unknown function (DUF4136)
MTTKWKTPTRRAWLLLPLLISACSTLQVYTVKSPTAPFAKYRTYAHGVPEKAPVAYARTPLTPAVWATVQGDVERELASKGYTLLVSGPEPDLLVRTGSGSRTVERTEGGTAHNITPENADWISADRVVAYTQATLVIDVFDAHTRQLVWHGSSERALDAQPTAVPGASVAESVRAILRTFPPAAGAPPAP